MTQLDQLRAFDADRTSTDEGIALSLFARQMNEEYERRKFPVPEWLSDKLRVIDRWLEAHRRDILELRLREAKATQSTLLTTAERRDKVTADIAKLEAELGIVPKPATV